MSNGATQITTALSSSTITSIPQTRKSHPTFHFLAGLTSGVSSAILLQPADLLKTRVQQSRSSSLVPVLRSILAGPNPASTLWRGTVPSALRTGFGSALYFTMLSSLRQFVANNALKSPVDVASSMLSSDGSNRSKSTNYKSSSVLPKLSATANLFTGATARVLAGLVLMPVTVIKVRYESDFYAYKSLASAVKSIYRSEGARGFFSGFGATAVRDAPYAGLYVVCYELGKSKLSQLLLQPAETGNLLELDAPPRTALSSVSINAASGVLAAATATAATNPFDAVKTRLQLMPAKYGNMVQATRLMIKEDGVKSFFDGLGLRMGRKALSSALAWTVYEELIGRAERRLAEADARGVGVVGL